MAFWALSRWFLRAECNRPNRAPSLFPLSRKSSRPSGVFALFSTTNHGWLLISKLGEENSRKLLSRIVFFFFFLLIKRRELSLRSRESLSRVIFHEWTLWINYPRIFFDFRCNLLCKNNSREFYFSRLGENNIFENRFWDLPSKNLSVRKIEIWVKIAVLNLGRNWSNSFFKT